jgi:4-hydroxybenzoate polyprenyltransferase
MRHLKPRDIVESLLFLICFTALFAFAGYLETAPLGLSMWMAGGLAIVLWIAYILIVVHQRKIEERRPILWMKINGKWVAQDGTGRIHPMHQNEQPIFDQDQKEAVS